MFTMIPSRVFRISYAAAARPSVSLPVRCIYSTSSVSTSPGRDPSISQGHVARESGHRHPHDPHDQAARGGRSSADKTPLDAASAQGGKQADRGDVSGNPEGIGFAEQVGSASASASGGTRPQEGKGKEEESTPPGFLDAVKSKLGFKTASGEVKQNRDGGEGVTGTGTFHGLGGRQQSEFEKRTLHTSAVAWQAESTKGQAPEASRKPKDRTYSEQNEHLQHRKETDPKESKGKGNTAEEPSLPSHQFGDKPASPSSQQRRTLYTSARHLEETKHTAESYFKDVDDSPPENSKTHQVDPSGTGAHVVRPNEPVTGDFSRAGPQTKEYATQLNREEPYDTPPSKGPEHDQKLRYGGTGGTGKHSGGEPTSGPGEGPEGASAGGRKPEGRS